ncbi:MAG: hypothetical protein KDH20_19260 [Rhodocyclaceae bacterium]|nr:hypothetical protein [Rhodocyclaceae bacterium]
MAEFAHRYLRERLLRGRIVLLLAVLVLAAGGRDPSPGAIFLLALLVVQFRMLDDFADRPHDAVAHPHRVTVTHPAAAALRPWALALVVPAGLLLAAGGGWPGTVGYGALLTGFVTFYAAAGGLPRLWRAQVVLLKYPAFVLLAAPAQRWPWAVLAWVLIALFEILTEPAWRDSPTGRVLIAVGLVVLTLATLAAWSA